jgi:hypothetical protein
MDINKRNRTELKSYFVKNAIPTESNFADLIEGALNQKDDGVVKLPGNPLSIEASGDATSLKKAINFYRNFSDANPDWTINLNPRSAPNDAATARLGFNVSDGDGNSRFFIDRSTGNVGIGTTSPGAKLEVAGDIYASNSDIYFTKTDHVHSGKGNPAGYAAIENAKDYDALMILGRAGTSKGRYVRVWDYLQVNGGLDVTGNVGIGTTTPKGFQVALPESSKGSAAPGPGVTIAGGPQGNASIELRNNGSGTPFIDFAQDGTKADFDARIRLTEPGKLVIEGANVGIGTTTPNDKLHVVGGDMRVDNGTLWLRAGSDVNHGIGWYGANKLFAGTNIDGPVVFGFVGGALGTTSGGQKLALSWNSSGNVGIGTTTIHNPQGWNKVVDILGTQHARLNVRSDGGVVTSVFSHDNWAGARGVIGTDSNHPLTLATNYTHRMTIDTAGNVGIGTTTPNDKLDVAGNLRILTGSNAIRFTAGWTGFPDAVTNQSEISNDTGTYKTLMIIGNKSNDGKTRRVSVWDRFEVNGDAIITGNLGTHGYSPTPKTSGWGGGIHTWDVEAEGTIWSRNGTQSGARDVAENYFSDETLEPGDVVRLDETLERIVRSEKPNDTLVVGVISSAPGVLLNVDHDRRHENLFPVALCGCVPCKVVDENGPIRRGDLLTSSSIPGYAMKARPLKIGDEELFRPGTIIGKALGSLAEGTGVIEIFVSGQ